MLQAEVSYESGKILSHENYLNVCMFGALCGIELKNIISPCSGTA